MFDEIEKAHPELFSILLQVLDDGRLTDGQGRTVDFKNTVIIMTSNVGSQFIQELMGKDEAEMRRQVMTALRAQFRPEFLNRIDDIILFRPLELEELKAIVDIQLTLLRTRLAEKKLTLVLTDQAKTFLAQTGYDRIYGARPLKRIIQRDILNPLAVEILQGKFKEGDTVEVDEKKGRLVFQRHDAASKKSQK